MADSALPAIAGDGLFGGQLVLAIVVVPAQTRRSAAIELGPIAGRFGVASVVALAILVTTGAKLASHLHLWATPTLQAKPVLLGLVLVLSASTWLSRGVLRLAA